MAELRFDNRVAVVTGGARGLGGAYATLLASRGAKVVVNDLGAAINGTGADAGPAEELVRKIKAAGGQAVASTDSVATPEGGQAIVKKALDTWGRIDIIVHNAGNVRRGSLKEMTYEDFDSVLNVHLRGAFHVVRPAFPHMSDAKYGRIILTSSDVGLYGRARVINYAVVKSAMIGMTNTIAIEGEPDNIKCNAIVPAAVTRLAGDQDQSLFPPTMQPEMVAHAVGYMAHESCAITGRYILSVGGRVARAYVGETRGVYRDDWTIEKIAENMNTILDMKETVLIDPVPTGHDDHLKYSFDMAKAKK